MVVKRSKTSVQSKKTTSRPSTRGTSQRSKDLPVREPGSKTKGRSWAFYGPAGSGKSTLASTFPGPVLFLDCRDDGDDSYIGVKDAKVRDITTCEEFEDTYWWLVENPDKFKTVVIDTVTMLQMIKVEEVSGAKARKSGKSAGDWGTMTKAQWGDVAAWLKTWITNYRDLGCEVVFIAQDRVFNGGDEEDPVGEISPEVGPRLSPSVKSHLCAAVSVVGYTFIRAGVREVPIPGSKKKKEKHFTEFCIRLGPSASYITKFRKPKEISLPDFLVDPTYEDILETIEGN